MPVTFVEIFPVGVLVSLISAALLRNSRFLPARQATGWAPARRAMRPRSCVTIPSLIRRFMPVRG